MGPAPLRVGTSYCQVTGMIPKSSVGLACSGVPCLHEEVLHTLAIFRGFQTGHLIHSWGRELLSPLQAPYLQCYLNHSIP